VSATTIFRRPVSDYATWRAVYDSATVSAVHAKHGVTQSEVLRGPDDAHDVTVVNRLVTTAAANALASDRELEDLMMHYGVAGPTRIESFESV
jgi:hypothetical protein